MSKCFKFIIEQVCKGLGYVYADSQEEAIELIKQRNYDDIYDTVDIEDGEIIDIDNGEDD